MLIPKLEQTPFLWGVPIWEFFRLPAHSHTGSPHMEMGMVVLTHPLESRARHPNFGILGDQTRPRFHNIMVSPFPYGEQAQ